MTRQLSIKSSKSNNKHGESHTTTGVVTNGGGPNAPKQLKQYSLKEVAAHCTMDSCWMVVLDKVYDFTDFIEYHPGGYELMLEYAGADATNAFIEKPHTIDATGMLDKYLIGELVEVSVFCLSLSVLLRFACR